ncbi:LysR family transcriptional regulator [Burkholderia lata]|uniref:hypothetical protein n=1 Tax=Burkholderia lata (strain ATCC 17760 / DSM 23089 / LMG 22485 / NCIMB 9086 / R18194 / 383) TaxID=482957 RepID=UPI001453DC00|nr:hypothetical protein [Burkholderia lata]VWD50880.1 LysR family transcriptional regulator [Burkholderia lata]
MQRMLRLHLQVSHVKAACRMIDANVRVLPERTAHRHAKPMALRVVALADEQTPLTERPPQICGADRDAPPRFARNPAAYSSISPPRPPGPTQFPYARAAISRFRADSALSIRQISHTSFV